MTGPGKTPREIEDLILRYRSGEMAAAEELIATFHPLIGKYMNLLLKGFFRSTDEDILKFLRCCGRVDSVKDYQRIAYYICTSLKQISKEELELTCQVALLETAKKFINIAHSYKFVLLPYIKDMLGDGISTTVVNLDTHEITEDASVEPEELDALWIQGVTAGLGFSKLTAQQRKIAKLCWELNIPDVHIRSQLGISRTTLQKEKLRIKEVLRDAYHIKEE
jgi:hypothetical protein